jgi:hypothetical protein
MGGRIRRWMAVWLAMCCVPALARDGVAPHRFWLGAAFEGDRGALTALAASGARVVRVYRESDVWVLDAAQQLGMRVIMGLWLAHPRHGFRLDDAAARGRQEDALRRFVERHRGHPALLAWAVGNEVETGVPDPRPVWREINRLAAIVKSLDARHPVLMVVADNSNEWLAPLADCCPDVDMLGLNLYGGSVFQLPDRLRALGIDKPVVVTELGPLGQWQAGTKPWGAPVELTSSQKADFFRDALAFLATQPQVRGAFPFLWGAKQEQTATWHGLLLADGSLTPMTDALASAWGRPVARAAPRVRGIGIAADDFTPGQEVSAGIDVVSPGGSPLTTEWVVRAEARDLRAGGDHEETPPVVAVRVLQAGVRSVRFVAPARPGAYRLFMTVRDGQGKAATANLPFRVR